MSPDTLSNSVRIGACVARQMNNGLSQQSAINETSRALGVSPATVCAALTIAQDFVADIRELQAA